MASSSPESMFDKEVIEELRRQFNEADRDGSGEIDAFEACKLFARSCSESASDKEIQKTAEALRHQVDTDRSGTISFKEYCFRFGRRYQMELNRRRRSGSSSQSNQASAADVSSPGADKLKQEREELEREREALRQERERLQLEKEREALRQEREALERERKAASGSTSSSSGAAGTSEVLAPGSLVQVQGLRAAPELNGRLAKVLRLDEAASRYVVEVEGFGQKSLRRENLVARAADGPGMSQRFSDMAESVKGALKQGSARLQVWIASSGYEWWQVLLGVAVVVLVISAWIQAGSRHSGPRSSGSRNSGPRASYGGDHHRHRDHPGDVYDDGYGYDSHSHYGGSHYGGYSDYGGGGGFDFGGMQKYLIIGGLAFLCWKGIIPVHRMDFFQLYMLWNMIQSTGILGGGGGYYGRRRRGFF